MKEALGHRLHDLLHYKFPDGTFRPGETCKLVQAFRKGIVFHDDDDYFITKEGKFISIEYSSAPLVLEGTTIGGVICFRDISERKAAERRINELYSTISHELRTPLTSIRGGIGLVEALNDGTLFVIAGIPYCRHHHA